MKFVTTCKITSLASGGITLGQGQPVTPSAFLPDHWKRMLAQGVIVEVQASAPSPELQFDNLTLLRGINDARQNELTALGIRTFEQLAQADVDALVRDMEVSHRTITGWIKKAREYENNTHTG